MSNEQENLAHTQQLAGVNVQSYRATGSTPVDWADYQWVQLQDFPDDPRLTVALARLTAVRPLTATAGAGAGITVVRTDAVAHAQGYAIALTSSGITVQARTVVGTVYGLTTLAQMMQLGVQVPVGRLQDAPEVDLREVQVDCGRKYYSLPWFKRLIDQMAATKANSLVLHFSDKNGFMIESLTAPEITSPQFLTQAAVRELIAYAAERCIDVTPELDMPGHLGHVLDEHPEYRLATVGPTLRNDNQYLDVTNPAAVAFAKQLVREYAELFAHSSPYFSIGADEYLADDFTAAGLAHYPALGVYATAHYGAGASGVEAFYDFLNDMGAYVRSLGYQPLLYHDRIYRRDATTRVPLAPEFGVKYWTHCRANMPTLETILDAGHPVINYDDNALYYVLGENAGYTYPQADKIYAEWDNGQFPKIGAGQLGNAEDRAQAFPCPALPAQLRGSAMSIWSDNYDAQTEDAVFAGFVPAYWAFAQKAWGAAGAVPYAAFEAARQALS